MRPLDKGPWPDDPKNPGTPLIFKDYSWAKRFLIKQLGCYCSYCEQRICSNLAIEHVQPKSLLPALKLDWDNFLLGCVNCNSVKLNKPIVLTDYFWPDLSNTLLAYTYDNTGIVKPNPALNPVQSAKARAMIELVGLDKKTPAPHTVAYYKASDLRHENRIKAWLLANDYLGKYRVAVPPVRLFMMECILTIVLSDGFWSVWMTVFNKVPEITNTLINGYPGTATNCFDAASTPINRNGADL